MSQRSKGVSVWAMVLAICLPALVMRHASGQAVAALHPAQLSGTWYEQAQYGVKREKNCRADTVLLVAPGNAPNQMLFVHSCKNRKHYTDDWQEVVFWKKGTEPTGKLRVRTLPLLSNPLSVVALATGDTPQWALLGTPNHKSLWVYARVPVAPEAMMAEIKSNAATQGFDVAKLVATPQPNR